MRSLKALVGLFAFVAVAGLVFAAEAPPNPKVEGKVTKVTMSEDGKAVTGITVSVGTGAEAKDNAFVVNADTKVTLNGAEAKAADVLAGDMASVEYTEAGEGAAKTMTATKVDAKREAPAPPPSK